MSIERDTSEGSSPSRRGATHVFAAYVMLLSILPLLGLGFASFEISRSALQNEAERHLTQLLHERKRFIDLQTEQVEGLIANVSGVEAITTGLAAPYDPADDYTRLLMQARIGYILNGYVNLKGLVSIDIFARNGAHYHVGDTLDVGHIRRELLEDLRRQAAASTRPVHWAGIVDNVNASSQHARVITAAKALYSFRPGAAEPLPLGLLLVNYDAAALQEPFGVPGTGDSIRLALVDGQGRLVSHSDARRIGTMLDARLREHLNSASGDFDWTADGGKLLIKYLRSEPSGWLLVGFIPLAAINAQAATIAKATALVVLLCLGLALAAAASYSRRVVRPLRRITQRFQQLQGGGVPAQEHLPVQGAADVAELTRWFNAFLDGLRERERAEQQALAERRARLVAEAASEAKSLFLAKMSHELRTPLNAVLGYAQILKRDARLDERQKQGLSTIHSSGMHLLALINDILDLAKIEAGKLELSATGVDLADFLHVINDTLRVKAEEKGLAFVYEPAPGLPRAVCLDDRRLRQVLLNLLGNAVKFTEQGEVRLRVLALPAAGAASTRLRFEIVDTGPGIAAHELDTAFQPFEQVGDGRSRADGTGLGLAISRQLVRLMGSDIHVDSIVGQGSCFSFELELPRAQLPAAAAPAALQIAGYEGPRKKVLVVDDVADNRSLAVHFLEPLGFEMFEAADGLQALEFAQALRPDLILMDVVMPRMDGLQATRALRGLPAFQSLPIIAASAISSRADEAKSLAAGADAFLPKPLDFERLLERIAALLKLRWTLTPPPSVPASSTR